MNIAIDFDGTCVKHDFPRVGADIGAVPVLKKITECGHRLILFTMRSGRDYTFVQSNGQNIPVNDDNAYSYTLGDAVNWFKHNDIPLWGIQKNPEQYHWTNSPKAYAHIYIDDAALGCPLIYPEDGGRPYVDWVIVEEILKERNII